MFGLDLDTVRRMPMLPSSRHSHCHSSPGLFNELQTSGRFLDFVLMVARLKNPDWQR